MRFKCMHAYMPEIVFIFQLHAAGGTLLTNRGERETLKFAYHVRRLLLVAKLKHYLKPSVS